MIKAIISMMSPRLELDFVESWLNHHRKFGFERFYIFSTSHCVNDQRFKATSDKRVWGKKPWANYHLDISDAEVDSCWKELLDCDDVVHRRIQLLDKGTGPTQNALLRNQLFEIIAEDVEWVAHIDGDELICGQLSWLDTLPNEVAAVHLPQVVLPERWEKGKSVPYREIQSYLGKINIPKCIGRISQLRVWSHIHCIKKNDTKSGVLYNTHQTQEHLRLHHFRGWKACTGLDGKVKVRNYTRFKEATPLPLPHGHHIRRAWPKCRSGLSKLETCALLGYFGDDTKYLEWGSGKSTALAAEQGVPVVTIGSDPHYTNLSKQSPLVDARYIDIGPTRKWGYPKSLGNIDAFRRYVRIKGVTPNLALVDGRFRVACVLYCMKAFPDATVAVHDFWSRSHYHDVLKYGRIVNAVGDLVFLRPRLDMHICSEQIDHYLQDPR